MRPNFTKLWTFIGWLLVIPLSTLVGAFIGFMQSLTPMGAWVISALNSMGCENVNLVDFGALVGFVVVFFNRPTK